LSLAASFGICNMCLALIFAFLFRRRSRLDPGEGRWPLGKDEDGEHLPLFHYFGYDKVDENENVTNIFAPGNFLRKYI